MKDRHRRWRKDRSYKAEYEALDMDALERFAHATGTRLRITFEPEVAR